MDFHDFISSYHNALWKNKLNLENYEIMFNMTWVTNKCDKIVSICNHVTCKGTITKTKGTFGTL